MFVLQTPSRGTHHQAIWGDWLSVIDLVKWVLQECVAVMRGVEAVRNKKLQEIIRSEKLLVKPECCHNITGTYRTDHRVHTTGPSLIGGLCTTKVAYAGSPLP